jgi:hypothetical protein
MLSQISRLRKHFGSGAEPNRGRQLNEPDNAARDEQIEREARMI